MTLEDLANGITAAEQGGVTEEMGRAVAAVASAELSAGNLATARDILESLAVSNPYDPATWTMLAVLDRRRGKLLSARVCAETAYRLAPSDPQVRLVRAEVLLCFPDLRDRAARELRDVLAAGGEVAARARALLLALGAA